jgi:hypothetical protein
MSDRTDILLAIQRHFPKESSAALEYFTQLNTNARGADWADALEMLCESDAHCDITEMVYDDLRPLVPMDNLGYIVPITLTLIYAQRGNPPFSNTIAYYCGKFTAKLESEVGEAQG